jgi:predicted O-methyltransferase YrrM
MDEPKAAKWASDGLNLTHELLSFVRDQTVVENTIQHEIRAYTANDPWAIMMIPPEQGQLMRVLALLVGARRIVEVGSFTGYSATWLADALPTDGQLIACDIDPDYLATATGFWEKAGLMDRIQTRLGPGTEGMQSLLDEGWAESVDMIFVDADKTGYPDYYELGLKLLRAGGILLFDNVLWSGRVADEGDQDPDTVALRAISGHAASDDRVDAAMLTDADGLLLVRKK